MTVKELPKLRSRKVLIAVIGLVLIILIGTYFGLRNRNDSGISDTVTTPQKSEKSNGKERSAASFCGYLAGRTEPSDYNAAAQFYKEAEDRAPSDIYEAVKAIRISYEEMAKNPEGALAINLQVSDAAGKFVDYQRNNCH